MTKYQCYYRAAIYVNREYEAESAAEAEGQMLEYVNELFPDKHFLDEEEVWVELND